MPARRKVRARDAQLAFEALSIEGGLLLPDWLSTVAQLQAGQQSESDYRIPKGLNVRDEMGRYWRIAQAHWTEFAEGRRSNADPKLLATCFVTSLLREAFGFTSLIETAPLVIAERSYPIGHAALNGRIPVVIAPADAGLDTLSPSFGDGGRRRSAFGLAQEFLNAQDGALWGLATDGVTLRIVRDNASLTRPAWIEADLGRIFTEERYADFAALWLLLHETRFGREGQAVTECALENWRNAGREEGTRARDHLRRGVEEALIALGQGFLAHPGNATLRSNLQSGALTTKDYFNQLLRLVYRLIFLLTVEERGLLHPPETGDAVKALYTEGYCLRRLRERSLKRSAHDRFADLWEATKIVFRGVAAGEPRLGLPALAGIFAASQCPAPDAAALENRWLLLAVFKLAWLREDGALTRVNWRDMGPEELGSVYESLLELVPQITQNGRQFAFATGGETKGNARKTTGSYYTPDSLVQALLDSALEPVIAETIARNPSDQIKALLALSIIDPACGSGHFLLAASRRLAAHVARLQANGTPSAAEYRHALRQVVGRCIYGVDLNPMAVELCKVSLWMEAVEPGLPLTFLNSHIQHGNALLGTTPELMAKGIPDKAWDPIEGDDKKIASSLKKRNKKESSGVRTLVFNSRIRTDEEHKAVVEAVAKLEAGSDASAEELAQKESQWGRVLDSGEYRRQKFVADAWCSAFVWPKEPGELDHAAPTNELWNQIGDAEGETSALTSKTVRQLSRNFQFFHWHLQFPQVFVKRGFDVVVGNPPWEALEVAENAAPDEQRLVRGAQHLVAASGIFALSGSGRKNLYALFVERTLGLLHTGARAGLVVPTELVQASETETLSRKLFLSNRLLSLCDFQNRRDDGHKWFPDVHPQLRFSLITLGAEATATRFAFDAQRATALHDEEKSYSLTGADVLRFCPTGSFRVPMFSGPPDARIMARAYRDAVLIGDLPNSELSTGLMFNFGKPEKERKVPPPAFNDRQNVMCVFEGENIHQFDHRFAVLDASNTVRNPSTIAKQDPQLFSSTATYLPRAFVLQRIRQIFSCIPEWLVVLRRQARAHDSYISIAAIVPTAAVEGSLTVFAASKQRQVMIVSLLNSHIINYILARRQSGPNVNKGMYSLLPLRFDSNANRSTVPPPEIGRFVAARTLELTYSAWDLEPFSHDLGYDGPPFRWDPARRFLLRCELDAAFFHLYGLSRSDTDYVMDTFPIVRKNDEKAHGEYRTKRVILEIYDAMAEAARTGEPYQTRLDPPPADPRVAHSEASRPLMGAQEST